MLEEEKMEGKREYKKKGEEIKPSSRIILKIKLAQKTINKKR